MFLPFLSIVTGKRFDIHFQPYSTSRSIGYTTPSSSGRSSLYCSDIGKMINAPVLHVNGDHPEGKFRCCLGLVPHFLNNFADVANAVETAFAYRNHFRKVCNIGCTRYDFQRFLQDIIIDLIVYRRWFVFVASIFDFALTSSQGDTTSLMSQHSHSH